MRLTLRDLYGPWMEASERLRYSRLLASPHRERVAMVALCTYLAALHTCRHGRLAG